jgi:hypothetical protein
MQVLRHSKIAEGTGRTKISTAAEQFRAEIVAGAQQFEVNAQVALPGPEALDAARTEVTENLRPGTDGMVAALTGSAAGLQAGLAQLTEQHTAALETSAQQARTRSGNSARPSEPASSRRRARSGRRPNPPRTRQGSPGHPLWAKQQGEVARGELVAGVRRPRGWAAFVRSPLRWPAGCLFATISW